MPSKEVDVAAIRPKAKPDPKAKTKSAQPKAVVAGETGQPCLFFPSGTCRRDPCPFVHETGASSSANPKAKASVNPKGKAMPKAVSHATAAASVLGSFPGAGALKTIFKSAATLLPLIGNRLDSVSVATQQVDVPLSSFNASDSSISWILDSGAGRTVGRLDQVPEAHRGLSDSPVNFSTGGGKRSGNISCRIDGAFSGDNECYLLESSPWALSLGEMVKKGKAFVWLPATQPDDPVPLPFVVNQDDIRCLSVDCPGEKKVYATRVTENVPIFEEHVEVSHMPVAEAGQENPYYAESSAVESLEYEPSLASEHGAAPELDVDAGFRRHQASEVSVDRPAEEPEAVEEVEEVAEAFGDHSLLHLPKDPRCEVCQQAKQDSRPARRVHEPHVLSDGEPATAFGDRIHADHIIVAKSRADRHLFGIKGERVVLILWDEFTKLVAAYPVANKSTAECVKALRHFIGRRAAVELHADNAVELESAAHEFGLVYVPTVPYRKTATINRKIRTIEDACRCCIIQGGRVHKLWPLAMQYVCTALSFPHWKSIHDSEFPGDSIPFAALVHYRPNERESKLGPKTSPGLFMGWRIEPGIGFKSVYKVVPLDSVRAFLAGKSELKIATTTKIVEVKPWTFPLKNTRDKSLQSIDFELELDDVPEPDAAEDLEGPEFDLKIPAPKDRFKSITLDRLMKYGPTPGCVACDKGTDRHSSECKRRFDRLVRESMYHFPEDLPKGFDQWRLEDDCLVRYHFVRRKKFFNPFKCDKEPPSKLSSYAKRVTYARKEDGTLLEPVEHENLSHPGGLAEFWTGKTVFLPRDGAPAEVPNSVFTPTRQRAEIQKQLPGYGTIIEFCCDENSNMGKLSKSIGLKHIRLTKSAGNMSDPCQVQQLLEGLESGHLDGCDLWGALPCTPWSKWQSLNLSRLGPKFRARLLAKRAESQQLLGTFLEAAAIVLRRGGRIHFEWPKGCSGWALPELQLFLTQPLIHVVECHACAFGSDHFKPWVIATTSEPLARAMYDKRCQHDPSHKHVHVQGKHTAPSGLYPMSMCECIIGQLFPAEFYKHVPLMPCGQVEVGEHSLNEPSKETFVDSDVPHFVHEPIDRKLWPSIPGAFEEIKKEADGPIGAGTWNYSEVIGRQELEARARRNGSEIHIGHLMSLLSWKNAESVAHRKLKARIVFRGDAVRDEMGDFAIFQDIKVTPTGISGVNCNLLYGGLRNHVTLQSDVVKAYVQSDLNTEHPTYVELSKELTPPEFRHIHRPCVRLHKSLYGHPESGGHWHRKFQAVVTKLGGKECPNYPSSFWFEQRQLLLTLYVDDILVSGPVSSQEPFWAELKQHLHIEPPAPVDRVLGRKHVISRVGDTTTIEYDMADFAETCVHAYLGLNPCKLKSALTPFLDESALPEAGWDDRGALRPVAARILMKCLG